MSKTLTIGGSPNITNSWTAYNPVDVYSDFIAWPEGQYDIEGVRRVYLESVTAAYISGGLFPLITRAGVEATSGWLASGEVARLTFRKNAGGTSYFGRNSASSPTPIRNTRDSGTWNGTLCATVLWSTYPGPIGSIFVNPHPTEELGAKIDITAPSEDGGSALIAYQLYQQVDGGEWEAVGAPGGSGQWLLTGLIEGASYLFGVAAINSRGTGLRTAAAAAYIPTSPSNINRYGGASFEDNSISRYDGATSDRATLQRWTGSAWADAK